MSSAPQQFMSFDYQTARKRMVFESLTAGVYYVFNNEIDGHIAEFGTGFSTRSIALAMASFGELMLKHVKPAYLESVKSALPDLYLFDSFAGLPAADNAIDEASPYVVSGRWHEGRFADLGKSELLALCTKFIEPERITAFEGWFKDALPSLDAGTKFAMLHLDCDLYSSTTRFSITCSPMAMWRTARCCSLTTGTATAPRRGSANARRGLRSSPNMRSNISTPANTPCSATNSMSIFPVKTIRPNRVSSPSSA